MSIRASISIDRRDVDGFAARAVAPGPVLRQVPGLLRNAPGGWREQTASRTFRHLDQAPRAWGLAPYERGPMPRQARDREQILFDGLLGRGASSVSRVVGNVAEVGVSDDTFKNLVAFLGNGEVSPAPYADTILGGFWERTYPANVVAIKAVRPPGTGGRYDDGLPGLRPKNVTAYSAGKAEYWYLLRVYGYDATESEIRDGIAVPPHNLGVPTTTLQRLGDIWTGYLLSGAVAA